LAVGVAVQSVVALLQHALKANLGLQFLGEPVEEATKTATLSVYLGTASDVFRAGGLFSHPNLLAGYLAMLLPICLAMLFSRVSPLAKLALAGTVALGLAALVITLSRSGWMSFATGFALLFVFSMLHQKLRLRYVLARLLVIVAILSAVGIESGDIIRRFTESDPGALKFRFDMMDTAWRMIADKPIFGLGLNSFVAYFPNYAPRPGVSAVVQDYGKIWPVVHDSYLITWTEQGTIGFICLCGLYLSILYTGLMTARRLIHDVVYAINIGATCGIVAIMVDGIGSFFIDEEAGQRVFWMVAALIVAIHRWTRANSAPGHVARLGRRRFERQAVSAAIASPGVPA
jgi:O-antigen ligase